MSVWGLPFIEGKPQGAPELLRADIGSSAYSLGLTASGALYIWKEITSRDIKIAPMDLNAGKLSGPPASFAQGFLQHPTVPSWSPDGKYLAYAACGGDCLAIRSVDTGEVRKLPRKSLYARDPAGHRTDARLR
jgi:Tol biopolymer transport system component